MASLARTRALLKRLERLGARGSFARNVAVLAGGSTMSQVATVLATPIVTRLYSPGDYGDVAVLASVVSVLSVFATLHYSTAITISKDEEGAAQVAALSLALLMAVALLAVPAVFLLGDRIVVWINAPGLRPYLWFVPLTFVGSGIYDILYAWTLRKKAFGVIARTRLQQSLGAIATKVTLGFFSLGCPGLLWGNLVSLTGGIGTLARLVWQHDKAALAKVSWRGIKWAARRYWRFPVVSTWTSLLQSLGDHLPTLLLASYYGSGMVGAFALAQRIVTLPTTLLGNSVGSVYYSEAARLTGNPRQLQRLSLKTGKPLLLLGLVPCLAFALGAPAIFLGAFGPRWREAGVYSQWLALAGFVRFVVSPISRNFTVLERQDLLLAWEVGRLALSGGGMYAAQRLHLSAVQAVAVYSAIMVISSLSLFAVSQYAIRARIAAMERQQGAETAL